METHHHMDETPLAVVGMAGRFPGAADIDGLWKLLIDGADAIGPVPARRWDAGAVLDPERAIQGVGGFIDGVEEFDAGFFGVSPREAAAIDPQQRLLLETAWRTLEDAGIPAAGLAGSRTGVYVGASWHDYELVRGRSAAPATPHSLVGNALDVIAARVSYFLKLRGPSMTVETGCSSSLVALHLAGQALRSGEIGAALVAGVNLILDPHVTVGLTHFGALSPDGRCATFSDEANGFVRGEGVAALCLKTLDRALADGDRIHGVIARTVVNNDGGGESLVTPSPDGQEDLIRSAYGPPGEPTGPAPFYIEAHGTGTDRGDPIEVTTLGRLLGRPGDEPLHVGSIKTNIGHLEACAGLAGLIKLLLVLRHRVVPPSLNSARLNPAIPFTDLGVRVVREPVPVPAGPVRLGVSSFGWGGTNAHVVVQDPPVGGPEAGRDGASTGLPPVTMLSAKDWPSLTRRAADLAAAVPAAADRVPGLAGTLAWRRDHFGVRAAVVGSRPQELRRLLDALAGRAEDAQDDPGLVTGRAVETGRVAFVYPGQGAQWAGMGRELYRDSPVFRDVIDRCAVALRPHLDEDLLDVFAAGGDDRWMDRLDRLQPVLWATALGLTALWRACGVEPDVVIGHSQGEVVAATVTGALSLDDAALVVARRSRIAARTSGRGRMLMVDLDVDSAYAALEGFEDTVALAAHNGPTSCVLSGDADSVLILKELLEAEGTYCRLVNVDYASHSPQMDALRPDLLDALSAVRPRPGRPAMMSTVRRALVSGTELDAAYWVDNLRRPVMFADAIGDLLDDGVTHIVEISPHPILVTPIKRVSARRAHAPAVLATLRRGQGTVGDFATAAAAAYVAGLEPFGGLPREGVAAAPGYPLRPEPYWPVEAPGAWSGTQGFAARLRPAPDDPGSWTATFTLSCAGVPWLAEHQVHGVPVLPGAAVLTALLSCARQRWRAAPGLITGLRLTGAVALGEAPVGLAAHWRDTARGATVRLLALPEAATTWEEKATARVVRAQQPRLAPAFPDDLAARLTHDADDFYRLWHGRGLQYGPALRGIRRLAAGDGRALGEIVLAERLRAAPSHGAPHPALIDAALQVALAACEPAGDTAVVPVALGTVEILRAPEDTTVTLWSYAERRGPADADVIVFDEARHPLMVLRGLRFEPLAEHGASADDALRYHLAWTEPVEPDPVPVPGRWALCTPPAGSGDALAEAMAELGAEVVPHRSGDTVPDGLDGVVFLAPSASADCETQERGLSALAGLATAGTAAGTTPRLAVITAGAQAVTADDVVNPCAALYWGFTRVLRREHGELGARLIDVDAAGPEWAARAAAEVLGASAEDQVALRGRRRLVARLRPGPGAPPVLPPPVTPPQPFRGAVTDAGQLIWVPDRVRRCGPGEVSVAVTAAAVDEHDEARLRGAATGDGDTSLGTSCAGMVTAVGPDITGIAVGDRVVACTPGALAAEVTVRADHTRPAPPALSDAEAAALPLVLTTAWHALVRLGGVETGDTVLIHAGTDGTALAGVALARLRGARVLATAGDTTAGELAESAGAALVVDTRDPDWTRTVLSATGGRGVDMVLHPQANPDVEIEDSLTVLGVEGRVVVLGADPVRVHPPDLLRPGVGLSVCDVRQLLGRHPHRFARTLELVWDLVAAGRVPALPVRTMTYGQAARAAPDRNRRGAQRLALTDPATATEVTPVPRPDGQFRADGAYLITGGLGALGLSLAEHLADRGAGALVLLGRSGPDPTAELRVKAMRAQNVQVEVVAGDVADRDALGAALAGVRDRIPPLRGVVHAAGVLADATVASLTDRHLHTAVGVKLGGARHLDALTRNDPLDFFVLFSSVAGLLGNPGQAAYSAANAALDAFAEARRRAGRATTSIQWGPFAGIGLAAAERGRGDRLASRGMGGIEPEAAWALLTAALDEDRPVTAYVDLDLRRWFDANPETAALPSWRTLLELSRRDGGPAVADGDFLARLHAAEGADRLRVAEIKVRELTGRVLRLDPAAIEADAGFKSLGLDSLLSLELRNRLESIFGLRLSPTVLWAHSSARALAGALCERLTPHGGPT
ncbi:polyketide synthase [Actinoplanes sp. SE50]|uniref:type I polyketide synthase n=1 Tax=unclassified Actinoplanes TaxID=2626549 RepID=UPI00023EC6B1|nr:MULTISPECIES: type I polyketide synthase [unclassified Actinoplanes]AEV87034.1 polyketide synthase [Actinoplanes sp. SE50/110]ATO85432.1 polyketide synthase [Actinoplanes sp. SE50]SLM02844.1 polyketide synthase [Actinoplanes sp. SE50/110]